MLEHSIVVSRHARYFLSQPFTTRTKTIWFVLHGYGQLASYFLKKFLPYNNEQTVFIAPEGLSKFYLELKSQRIGASWMTRDDREHEIADYQNYLNQIYQTLITQITPETVNVLAFSQGCATLGRWLSIAPFVPNRAIFWAGMVPHDWDYDLMQQKLSSSRLQMVVGKQDEFYKEEQIKTYLHNLKQKGFVFEEVFFEGKHEIPQDILHGVINS